MMAHGKTESWLTRTGQVAHLSADYSVEHIDKNDADRERRLIAYQFKAIREQAGMNRKDFSDWLGIPYRTMQEWELGRRQAPDYVLRLIAYKVKMEKERGNL